MMYWIRYHGLARNHGKPAAVGNGSEQQVALHHREVHTNADTRARAERHESIAGKLFLAFRRKALGIKPLRVREIFLAAMQRVGGEEDNPAFGDKVAVNLDIPHRAPGGTGRG